MRWLLVTVFLICALPSPGYSAEDQVLVYPTDPMVQEFVRLVNAKRRSLGCAELKWDSRVAAIAFFHSADMVSRHFFSHTNPDKKGPAERLQASHLGFSSAAENLVRCAKTAPEAFDAWLRSPGHCRNMLDTRFTRHGVGRVQDRWTHILIRPSPIIQPGQIRNAERGVRNVKQMEPNAIPRTLSADAITDTDTGTMKHLTP